MDPERLVRDHFSLSAKTVEATVEAIGDRIAQAAACAACWASPAVAFSDDLFSSGIASEESVACGISTSAVSCLPDLVKRGFTVFSTTSSEQPRRKRDNVRTPKTGDTKRLITKDNTGSALAQSTYRSRYLRFL